MADRLPAADAATVRALERLLRETIAANATLRRRGTELTVVVENMTAVLRHQAAGQAPPPDLAARVYRSMRETGDDAAAEQARDLLHREPAASDTLALLSDDPWWRRDVGD